jgi:monovalent cation:H+ antiporter-2, CPA2 family
MFVFRDIAMILSAALIAGLLFWRLRQPLILGYVLAGLILSPLTPGPQIHEVHTFEVMAEAGVIFLMFTIGTEFSIPEMMRVKWLALVGAPIGICLSIAMGAGAGLLLGWPVNQGIAVGGMICVASTMVLMRLLMERGELATEAGRIMITLTLVEDLAVVILTVLLPGLSSSGGAGYLAILWKIGKAIFLLAPVVFAGWKVVPRMLDRVEKTGNDELAVLLALTICIVVAAITEALGLSLALGAFVGGILLGNSHYAHRFAAKVFPIRDTFVALFFVTVGMLIDPRALVSNWRILAVVVGLILVGKFAIWFAIVRLFRYPVQRALRVSIGLTQIGELSFVLARLSLRSSVITDEVYNAVLAASLVTILINAILFKLVSGAPQAVPQKVEFADA